MLFNKAKAVIWIKTQHLHIDQDIPFHSLMLKIWDTYMPIIYKILLWLW
jgi:hypothetical protein